MFQGSMIYLIVLMLPINIIYGSSIHSSFKGRWCWERNDEWNNFGVNITKVSNMYLGEYSMVAYGGSKLDSNDESFQFSEPKGYTVKTKFRAGSLWAFGLVELKILGKDKMGWRVLQYPEGEVYVPKKALLNRCDGT